SGIVQKPCVREALAPARVFRAERPCHRGHRGRFPWFLETSTRQGRDTRGRGTGTVPIPQRAARAGSSSGSERPRASRGETSLARVVLIRLLGILRSRGGRVPTG